MDAEKLNQELYDKMMAEQEEYRSWLLEQTPEEILNHVFEYSAREDILLEVSALALPGQQAAALLTSPSPLADIYKDFRNTETNQMEVVADCIERRADALLQAQYKKTRAIPLYQQSGEYAREHGELEIFRASRKANEACRDAIDAEIRDGYNGTYFTVDPTDVLAEFGPERVSYVLAATLQSKTWDYRISRSNQAWAAAIPMVEAEDRRSAYLINSHPALLDGFVNVVRDELADLSGLIADPHLYSTVHVTLLDSADGEAIEPLYDRAGQYQEAISKGIAAFHTEQHPSNDLMQHFRLPDDPKMEQSIRNKVQSACVSVEASEEVLYARLDLSMSADLTHEELDAFTGQIESQYRDGWGAEFEVLTIPAGKEAVCLRLWNDDIRFFPASEKERYFQRDHSKQAPAKTVSNHKPSIRDQLAVEKEERPQQEPPHIIPIYYQSGQYAQEHGELEAFHASRKAHIACRDAIETVLSEDPGGMSFATDINYIFAEFGPERVSYVLAATLQSKPWDEQFSRSNHAWAETIPMVEPKGHRSAYIITSDSRTLDAFINKVRKELDAMREQPEQAAKKPSIRDQLAAAKAARTEKTAAQQHQKDKGAR